MKHPPFRAPSLLLFALLFHLATFRLEAGEFAFSARRVAADEGQSATIEVTRTGDLSKAASVKWQTAGATARAGRDFQGGGETLDFAPGVAARQVAVVLHSDEVIERSEHFFVLLSHPSRGNRVAFPFIAIIEIRDATMQCAGDIAKHFDFDGYAAGLTPPHAAIEQNDGSIIAAMRDWETARGLRRYWPDGREDATFQPEVNFAEELFRLRNGQFIASSSSGHTRLSSRGKALATWTGGGRIVGEYANGTLLSNGRTVFHRLSRDGAVLSSFPESWEHQPASPFNFEFAALAADGRIVSTWFANDGSSGLVKIDAAGRIDELFVPEIAWTPGVSGRIGQLLLLADGSMLVAGDSLESVPDHPDTAPRSLPPVVKLLPNGRLDPAFHYPPEWAEFSVNRLSLDPDGRILIAMQHSEFSVLLRRIGPDGSADPDFAAALEKPGDDTPWSSLESGPFTQKDGSIFVVGSISAVNGQPTSPTYPSYSTVMLSLHGKSLRCPGFIAPMAQPILVSENAGTSSVILRRVRGSHGSLNVPLRLLPGTAMEGEDFPAWAQTVVFGPGEIEKTILLPTLNDALLEPTESAFLQIVEEPEQRLLDRAGPVPPTRSLTDWNTVGFAVRIVDDESAALPGTPDFSFHPILSSQLYPVKVLARPSGKILLKSLSRGGGRDFLNQFLPDGTRDPAFAPDLSGLIGRLIQMQLDDAGRLFVMTDSGQVRALDESGRRISGFGVGGQIQLGLAAGERVNEIERLSDGSFVGNFRAPVFPGSPQYRFRFTRFLADGTAGFSVPFSSGGLEHAFLAEQSGGRLLIREWRTSPRSSSIVRWTVDGAVDPAFQRIAVSPYETVRVRPLANGRLLVADDFLRWYEADGAPIPGWPVYPLTMSTGGLPYGYRSTTLFEDNRGRIVLGGSLEMGLQRFLPDGSRDASFFIGTGVQPYYNGVQMAPALDGSGHYYGIGLSTLNDLPLPSLFRLFGEGGASPPHP